MLDDYKFVASHVHFATRVPKQTIPSPSVVHFRGGRDCDRPDIYPTLDGFFADLGEAYNKAVASFGAAGCQYLQIDEVNIAYLCDPEQIAALKARGEHVDNLLDIYGAMLNRAIEARPAGMTISMHLCRGNFRSTSSRPAATNRWPRCCSIRSTPMPTSWNTTPIAPAASSRCASCRAATRSSCSAW